MPKKTDRPATSIEIPVHSVTPDIEKVRVILNGASFQCTKCGKILGSEYFGLRKVCKNGLLEVRNQSWCAVCRHNKPKNLVDNFTSGD